jgi:hypothetical protein
MDAALELASGRYTRPGHDIGEFLLYVGQSGDPGHEGALAAISSTSDQQSIPEAAFRNGCEGFKLDRLHQASFNLFKTGYLVQVLTSEYRDDLYEEGVTSWVLQVLHQQVAGNLTSGLRQALVRAPPDVRLYTLFKLCTAIWLTGDRDAISYLSDMGHELAQGLQYQHRESVVKFNAIQIIMLLCLSVVWPTTQISLHDWFPYCRRAMKCNCQKSKFP